MSPLILAILQPLITQILKHLWPHASPVIGLLLTEAIPATVEFIDELATDDSRPGHEKRQAVIGATHEYLDEALDHIPEWSDVPEKRRDRMLGGLAEFAYWMSTLKSVAGRSGKIKGKIKRQLRKGRR